jgi:hypothetical protein
MPLASVLQDAQLAAADIEATIGIYREGLGRESNAISGKAILSRQREGDVGTFVYTDNLADAVAQGGVILVDLIPRVMDTEQQARIFGDDGTEEFVQINATLPDGRKVNDLRTGRYDVVSSVGPSFSTQREEARESMMAFFSANPAAAASAGDIFAKTMEWPGSEEFAARLRRQAIMGGMVTPDPNNEEDAKLMQGMGEPKPDPNMVLAQAEGMKAQAQVMRAQADATVKAQELEVEKARLMLEAEKLQLEQQKLAIEQQRLALDERKVAAGAMTDAADTQSKIAEREASTRIASVEAMQDMIERVMDRRAAMMPKMPEVQQPPTIVMMGKHDDDDGEGHRAVMERLTSAMERMGKPRVMRMGKDGSKRVEVED